MAQQQALSSPPPRRGNNLKFVFAGLLLLAGAAGMWLFIQSQRTPPVKVSELPAAPPAVERANPMAQNDLVVEEEKTPEPEKPVIIAKKSSRSAWGDWDCAGDLPGQKINQILADNRQQVRSCYERRLKVNNVLEGNLNLKLKVNSSGTVVATAVGGTLGDNDVFACVRNLAKQWAFPQPAGGECAVVQVPFRFTPHKD